MATKSRTVELIIRARDRATSVLKRISGGLKSWGALALKTVAAVGTAFVGLGAGITALGRRMANLIDEQAKVASSLGIANEALGAMRDAANMAGISSENLTTSLRRMSQTLADALDGSGKGADALRELGLSADELQKMQPEQAFTAIIAELDKIPNGLQKTALAMDIFGRSGAQMTNMTIAGLRQAQRDAEELGLKLTSAQAAGVEAANDAWSRIKTVFSDFLKNVTGRLAPGVRKAFDRMFEFVKGQDLQKWAANAALGIAQAFRGTLIVLGAVGEAIIGMTRGLATAAKVTNQIIGGLAAVKLANIERGIEMAAQKVAELEEKRGRAMGRTGKAAESLIALTEHEYQTAVAILEENKKQLQTYTNIADKAVEIDAVLSSTGEKLKEFQGFSMSPEVTKALNEMQISVDGFEQKTKTAEETSKKAGGTMEIAFSGSAKAAEIAGDKMSRINSILEEMARKADTAATKIKAIPSSPPQFSSGGVDYINKAERTE